MGGCHATPWVGLNRQGAPKRKMFRVGNPMHAFRLLLEMAAIALSAVVIFAVIHTVFMKLNGTRAMTNHALLFLQVGLSAGMLHGLFEVTGLNKLYCKGRE